MKIPRLFTSTKGLSSPILVPLEPCKWDGAERRKSTTILHQFFCAMISKKRLAEIMSHEQVRYMYITGPLGSGKTTYCLFYFMDYMLANNSKRKKV
mmetsp:Transcript_26788/g.38000  ORF Transcript_26788/g.38000 Transcript_26788/m.38000 type:complete len:96 (-) Transcript_26788:754-1041(-)